MTWSLMSVSKSLLSKIWSRNRRMARWSNGRFRHLLLDGTVVKWQISPFARRQGRDCRPHDVKAIFETFLNNKQMTLLPVTRKQGRPKKITPPLAESSQSQIRKLIQKCLNCLNCLEDVKDVTASIGCSTLRSRRRARMVFGIVATS